MSIREKILSAQDIREKEINVPEWEVNVLVRGLTGRQRAKLLQDAVDTKGKLDLEKIYPEIVIFSAYDPETGKPVFEPADRDILAEKSGAALERIAQAAMGLSGLHPDSINEAEKN